MNWRLFHSLFRNLHVAGAGNPLESADPLMRKLFWILLCSFVVSTAQGEEKAETELGAAMSKMNRAFRQLKKQTRDPVDFAGAIKSVGLLKEASKAAAGHRPELAAEKAPDTQPGFIAEYHEAMREMLKVVDQLETSLKAGDRARSAELVAKLSDLQKSGHKKFKKPD